MISRPKPEENEEDLLRLESEFLGKVINPKVKPSLPEDVVESNDTLPGDNIVRDRLDFAAIPGNIFIRERRIDEKNVDVSCVIPNPSTSKGFPRMFTLDKQIKVSPGGKSIFARQLQAKRENKEDANLPLDMQSRQKKCRFGEKTTLQENKSGTEVLMQEIHLENVRKLESLSEEEITLQRNALLSQLNPQLIQLLKNRRTQGKSDTASGSCAVIKEDVEEPLDSRPSEDTMVVDSVSTSKDEGPGNTCDSMEEEIEAPKTEDDRLSIDNQSSPCDAGDKNSEMSPDMEIPEDLAEGINKNRWLHMDVKEVDKLKWIGEIPKPIPVKDGIGHVARFDFEGVVLPYDADLPVTQALHHHGSEPGRPGYTLDELLILSRSSVTQQRTLALTTLAAILKTAKQGYYDSCLDEPLLPLLVERDILTLFRFSLDENSHLTLLPAALAISQLMVDEPDEICLDLLLGLPRGLEQPCLTPKSPPETDEETKDNVVARGDLVKGALQMDILPRIRYILEVLRPPPKAVISLLELLTRLARHSKDIAETVASFPRLMNTICSEFLPSKWHISANVMKPLDMPSVYGVPLAKAVKLMRILACSSPNFAYTAVTKYGIMKSLLAYVSVDPGDSSLPKGESLTIALEGYYLWQVLLHYGLTSDYLWEFTPILMSQLHCHQCVSMEVDESSKFFDHEFAAALLGLLETSLTVSSDGTILSPASNRPPVGAQIISVVMEPLTLCLRKWFTEVTGAKEVPKFSALKLLGSCLTFLSTAFSKADGSLSDFKKEIHQCVKCIYEDCLTKFMECSNYRVMMKRLWSHSSLRPTEWTRVVRDPMALPSAGGVRWRGEITPILRTTGPLPFLLPLANFLVTTVSFKHMSSSQILSCLMQNSNLLQYIVNIAKSKELNNDWFCRYERHFIVSVVRLAASKVYIKDVDHVLFHSAALAIAPLLSSDDALLKAKLFNEVIFEPAFFGDASQISPLLSSLEIENERVLWSSATGQITDQPKIVLLQEALTKLPEIAVHMMKLLGIAEKKDGSYAATPEFPSLLHNTENSGECLGVSWFYKPLADMCPRNQKGSGTEPTPPEKVAAAEACLQWIFLMEFLRPSSTALVSPTLRFSYLSYIFLIGNDLFLEKVVHSHLSAILKEVLNQGVDVLDFDERFLGLPPFKDLYVRLLLQFDAVSYGDSLFSHVILMPLAQKHNLNYRLLVWGERVDVLRCCTTAVSQLLVPIQSFMYPLEKDPVLLELYLRSLAVGIVREARSPVPYKIAVHHLGSALKEPQDEATGIPEKVLKSLRSKVEKFPDKSLANVLLNYCP